MAGQWSHKAKLKSLQAMENLIKRLNELGRNRFSGVVTLSFYKGSLSKKIKIEVTENLKLDENLIDTDGIKPNGTP